MLSRVSRAIAALMIALLPVAATAQAPAQTPPPAEAGTGTVSGLVRDTLGGPIGGAVIRVVSEITNEAFEAFSNEQGVYRIENLVPGQYRLEVTLSGFDTVVRRFTLFADQATALDISLVPARFAEGVVVTARRIEESIQEVPIPVSAVSGQLVADAGAFNISRLQEFVPTVQFYSTNPRNTTLNIRGLGQTIGLTNDGLEPGVGLYVDGVFYVRPAATTFDFIDVDQIEVLRGPQGTLFGKNTTAGAILITTRRPSFTPETNVELSYGNYGFVQAKASLTGPIGSGNKVAGRLSFAGTQRDGTVYNVRTQDDVNDLNNLGIKGQLLITPTENVAITFAADNTRQRPEGFAQVIAGVAPTLRNPNRQWAQIAADLNYQPPSYNAFDRLIDTDTPWRSYQDLGGASLNVDWELGPGRLTSTTAWRYWDWNPSNDRDWTGLSAVSLSQAPSKHRNWTQEVRYAGDLSRRLGLVVGFFTFSQTLKSDPAHTTEAGSDAWRHSLTPGPLVTTPGLVDGYGERTTLGVDAISSAVFSQLEWKVTDRLRLLPGLRFNYDKKQMDFNRVVYGGLQTDDPALISLQRGIFAPQAYATDVDDTNVSGQFSVAYKVAEPVNTYVTYSTSFKSVGLNLGGVPAGTDGQPALNAASVRPEDTRHFEAGIKTTPRRGITANFTVYNTAISDFQAQVQNAQLGVQRGYLANVEKVRVRGAEFDGSARVGSRVTLYGAFAYTDGKYISFPDAPVSLENTGLAAGFEDASGTVLPGISTWAGSFGGEVSSNRTSFFGRTGEVFGAIDASSRSSYSSSSTYSAYLVVPARTLVNGRIGFRATDGWSLFLWGRNLANVDYYETLQPGAGGTGLFTAQLGEPRAVGISLRLSFSSFTN